MKLYYVPGACSLAPHIVAREAALPVEIVRVDPRTKQHEGGGDYNAINPKSYVPALALDDGAVLTEASVILQYLADRKPEAGLAPQLGTMERYRLMEWLNFVATELHKGYSPLFNPSLPKEARAILLPRLEARLGHVAARLERQPYVTGERYTVADAYLYTVLRWSPRVAIDLARWPSLGQFLERIAARPAVQQALKEEGLA